MTGKNHAGLRISRQGGLRPMKTVGENELADILNWLRT
jgi:hypothetical protein